VRKNIKPLAANLFVIAASLACAALTGERQAAPAPTPIPTETAGITPSASATEVSCNAVTDEAIRLALDENDTARNFPWGEIFFLVKYDISSGKIAAPEYVPDPKRFKQYQKETASHERVWEYFAAIIPEERRSLLKEFIIATDSPRGLLAAVTQTEEDPEEWALLVDILDTENDYELTYTLIHEFAHLLTLGPDQVPPSLAMFEEPEDPGIYFEELSACYTYFTGEGCANLGSYMDDFYNQFWSDIYEEWNKIEFEQDRDEYRQNLEQFYLKYQERFVTDYAATRPEEDIAESFTFFILAPKPAGGTMAEQKILFFYNYPELVELRQEILMNVCENFPR
jgi:hypothetical protein